MNESRGAKGPREPRGSQQEPGKPREWREFWREGLLIVNALAALLLFVALWTHSPDDPGFSNTGTGGEIANAVGIFGAWLADLLFFLVGYLAFVIPAWLLSLCFLMTSRRAALPGGTLARTVGLPLIVLSAAGLAALHLDVFDSLANGPGGIVGELFVGWSEPLLASFGSSLLLLALLLLGSTLCFSISWAAATAMLFRSLIALLGRIGRIGRIGRKSASSSSPGGNAGKPGLAGTEPASKGLAGKKLAGKKQPKAKPRLAPKLPQASANADIAAVASSETTDKPQVAQQKPAGRQRLIDLLDPSPAAAQSDQSRESLEAMSSLLAAKLLDYGIEVEVTAIKPGPVITRFEVQPAAGIKGNRITSLVKDLARSLAVVSVRVVEHIPGRNVIGIEIPNEQRELIRLGQVLESREFSRADSVLSLALGHDILGRPIIVDLGKMPHLLVAGTTGSGKSVGVNAMILSLLFKAAPEQVRLLMIDPKMLELSVYEGIPHLLTPVVTDMKEAANALRWCVAEMDRRYALLAALGVRNLAGYNRKVAEASKLGKPLPDPQWQPAPGSPEQQPPQLEPLPNIVVIVDELADMMMVVGKKVEELVARIAQKARAAGIHLILATQRPSVDVLTGLIKANIPTRLSFMVQSKVDSRTILGEGGAEQLLGNGDMLFLPPGGGVATRVHGAFVSDEEVHRVVAEWKRRGEPVYVDAVTVDRNDKDFRAEDAMEDDGEIDDLYDEAVHFVTESRKASISAVQRKLRIGYNRAARMIDMMEQQGVVSATNSNGVRDVLAQAAPSD